MERVYLAIDLKSFYASVECVERNLDPLQTNLVVADESRTEKTICLAVSPSLKKYGIKGRARLFEVVQKVNQLNRGREEKDKITYITAPPRMALYMQYSTRIYHIYLKYVAPEDIEAYSIDEVFIDITHYLNTYKKTPRELAQMIILDVLKTTGITATAGIGSNLYLCKIAMDIEAKHIEPDENGVRIAELDEISYRKKLWNHRPITDFWRVGRGYARKLEQQGMYTMGDVARCSIGKDDDYYNEDLLYQMFGVNAELLIDHAWGYEPCTLADVKAYQPEENSISNGQVLQFPYDDKKTRVVVREMTDELALALVEKGLVTDQLVLTIGYDIENLTDEKIRSKYHGEIKTDVYGRKIPKHAHGTIHLDGYTSSTEKLLAAIEELYDRIINPLLLTRRITIAACRIRCQKDIEEKGQYEQMNLFTDYGLDTVQDEKEKEREEKEKKLQQAILKVKTKYGKNAVLKGMNFEEGATGRSRNKQIGGHKA